MKRSHYWHPTLGFLFFTAYFLFMCFVVASSRRPQLAQRWREQWAEHKFNRELASVENGIDLTYSANVTIKFRRPVLRIGSFIRSGFRPSIEAASGNQIIWRLNFVHATKASEKPDDLEMSLYFTNGLLSQIELPGTWKPLATREFTAATLQLVSQATGVAAPRLEVTTDRVTAALGLPDSNARKGGLRIWHYRLRLDSDEKKGPHSLDAAFFFQQSSGLLSRFQVNFGTRRLVSADFPSS